MNMKESSLPILIRLYKKEIDSLFKQKRFLSLIIVSGVLSELIAREIVQEKSGGYERLLKRLLKDGVITPDLHKLFDEIRECRNNYIHVSSDKVIQNRGYSTKDANGIVTFLEEDFNNDPTENQLAKLYKATLFQDAMNVYKLTGELITNSLRLLK